MGFFVSRHLGLPICNIAIMKRFLQKTFLSISIIIISSCDNFSVLSEKEAYQNNVYQNVMDFKNFVINEHNIESCLDET